MTASVLPRGPYEFDEAEQLAVNQEAAAFASTIAPWPIPQGNGTYKEKRPGLGITIHGYEVDCSVEPHKVSVQYAVHAWRTYGEDRFGDNVKGQPRG